MKIIRYVKKQEFTAGENKEQREAASEEANTETQVQY